MKRYRRQIAVTCLVLILIGILMPVGLAHAASGDDVSDPWYVKIFVGLFDNILKPFSGISEPADHIFKSGLNCDDAGNCSPQYWGIYDYEQYHNAIFRGYTLFSIFIGAFFVSAVIKISIQFSYSPLSSALKVHAIDVMIRTFIALLLLMHFFDLVGVFFKLNEMGVALLGRDIHMPINLSAYGADLVGNFQGAGDRLTISDLANDMNGFKRIIVNFFSIGISIWFEGFYLMRLLMISILIILAPIWIATMFFPMLQGITGAAMKELWAQIISQFIHAALFWLFYWLFNNNNLSWLQLIMALAMFIPISESVRFMLGATSHHTGKLATIATLAGAGTLMHGARAVKDLREGMSMSANTFRSRQEDHRQEQGASEGSTHGNSPGRPANAHASKLAGVAAAMGGAGKGLMRFGGSFSGVGLGPMGQYAFAEAGAYIGEGAGHRMGAVSYGMGSRWWNKTKDSYASIVKDPESAGLIKRVGAAFAGGAMGTAKTISPLPSKDFRTNAVYARSSLQRAGGIIGEGLLGKGGYDKGANFLGNLSQGMTLTASSLKDGDQVVTVETRDGSWLARQAGNGDLSRISNVNRGNLNLKKGQTAFKEYVVMRNEAVGAMEFKSIHTPAIVPGQSNEIRGGLNMKWEPTPAYTHDPSGQRVVYEGKTVNPMEFMQKTPVNHVDIRRRSSLKQKDFTGGL